MQASFDWDKRVSSTLTATKVGPGTMSLKQLQAFVGSKSTTFSTLKKMLAIRISISRNLLDLNTYRCTPYIEPPVPCAHVPDAYVLEYTGFKDIMQGRRQMQDRTCQLHCFDTAGQFHAYSDRVWKDTLRRLRSNFADVLIKFPPFQDEGILDMPCFKFVALLNKQEAPGLCVSAIQSELNLDMRLPSPVLASINATFLNEWVNIVNYCNKKQQILMLFTDIKGFGGHAMFVYMDHSKKEVHVFDPNGKSQYQLHVSRLLQFALQGSKTSWKVPSTCCFDRYFGVQAIFGSGLCGSYTCLTILLKYLHPEKTFCDIHRTLTRPDAKILVRCLHTIMLNL